MTIRGPQGRQSPALGQFSRVQQFHEQRYGSAYLAFTVFPFTDGPKVADAETRGKAGLCKPSPLTDGFECGRGHLGRHLMRDVVANLIFRFDGNDKEFSVRAFHCAEIGSNDAVPRVLLSHFGNQRLGLLAVGVDRKEADAVHEGEWKLTGAKHVSHSLAGEVDDVGDYGRAVDPGDVEHLDGGEGERLGESEGLSGGEGLEGHFHSPVSGGAWPRLDDEQIGPLGRYGNGQSHSVRRILQGRQSGGATHRPNTGGANTIGEG